MAEVINLRLARKAKARQQAAQQAQANRARHGQTKAERTAQRLDTARAERQLDGARREDPS
jgi:hypothetical protein